MIRIAHGKEATQITVFRTCSALKVSQQADGIFFLEIDIHHIRLVVLTLLAKEFTVLAILIVYTTEERCKEDGTEWQQKTSTTSQTSMLNRRVPESSGLI